MAHLKNFSHTHGIVDNTCRCSVIAPKLKLYFKEVTSNTRSPEFESRIESFYNEHINR